MVWSFRTKTWQGKLKCTVNKVVDPQRLMKVVLSNFNFHNLEPKFSESINHTVFIQRFRTSALDVAPILEGGKGRSNRRSLGTGSTLFQPWSAPKIRERRAAGAVASTAGASAAGGFRCRVRARPWGGGATTSEPSEISSGAVSDEFNLAAFRSGYFVFET